MNWAKALTTALEVGVAIHSVSNIDKWINEKITELGRNRTRNQALVEAAYEVAKMDNKSWTYLVGHLKVKMLRNDQAKFFYDYCNYVVNLENNQIKSLLSYNINESIDLLAYNINKMETYEMAAYYGILKAYSERNFKAKTLLGGYQRLLG